MSYRTARFLGCLAALVIACAGRPVFAQQADVIRGRVTNANGAVLASASIVATSIPNNVTKSVKADRNGRFTITFANGDGDYWITVTAIGYTPKRFELKRLADEDVLIADASLEGSGVLLDSVRVRGNRERAMRNDAGGDISGTEKSIGNAAVSPAEAGNIAAMASALPGVQLIPGADGNPDQFSVFGLGGDQNRSTLNGLSFGAGDVPRDASMRSALGVSPWDVSRGGFSGGLFTMKTQSGSNFSARGLSSLLNTPQLEWTDRAGRAAGAEFSLLSLGASTSGPVTLDQSFYSAGYQIDRRAGELQTLASANDLALMTAGIARDSVIRFRSLLDNAGVPRSVAELPSSRVSERGMLLGTFDVAPPTSTSGQALNITAVGSVTRLGAPLAQIAALPTTDARSTGYFASLQARHTNYFGFGVLTETSVGFTRMGSRTNPYLAMPNGSVRVTSDFDDGSSAISQMSFGGGLVQATENAATTLAAQNQLSWFTADNKHRLKLTSEVRYDRYRQDLSSNTLGTFIYNSLADLEAGTPASFTRLLSPRVQRGSEITAAVSLGDSYRPSPDFQLQYGLRVDANRYLSTIADNAAVERVFGVRNNAVPNRISVSPRVGFSWTYGTAPQLAIGSGFTRGPRAVVRGGVGVFQNTPNAQLTGGASTNTGLPGFAEQLVCVGAAVPVPDWASYRGNPSAIPSTCADGSAGGSFASRSPSVLLLDPSFTAARSVRGNLNWSGALPGNRFAATADATYSFNLDQPGMSNLNFDPRARFALADEGSRPVFVRASSIVPSTGVAASQDSRLSADFARVLAQQSDLESRHAQFSVGVRPLAFSTKFGWSVTYVYSRTRDLASGFTSTDGDPRERAWGRSPFDSRHQLVYGLSYNLLNWFPVSLTGSIRAGRPYTPMIAGDVNGDGFNNDRAFVFDPRTLQDAVAQDVATLLANSGAAARRCLESQLGRIAARNSCQGPWTATSNLTIALNPVKFRLPQRLNIALFVNNALGAADLLLHGENKRRGWGQSVNPDATLLYVRGFDPATQRYRYEVNPRFGSTALSQVVNRNPVVVTLQARIDIGYARERQLLTQSLDKGRIRPGTKSTDQELASMGTTLIPANPMVLILQQTDSLKLTRKQADSLSTLNRAYSLAYTRIWNPVAKYLASLPSEYNRGDAYARYRTARESTIDALMKVAPGVRGLLTPAQLRMLPAQALSSLDTRYLASVRSSTSGGADMGVLGMLAQMGWMGGSVDASQGSQTIMVHR